MRPSLAPCRARGAAKPYTVRYRKHDQSWRNYGSYADRDEAERVAALLKWAGAVAVVHVETLQ